MGLADELLDDARFLAQRGVTENRLSSMRRAVSTAYYALFHLLVNDFVSNWPSEPQRARLARMFDHRKMREAKFSFRDESNPTAVELLLAQVKRAFVQLQEDRHKADYDLSWEIAPSDVEDAIKLTQEAFTKWRTIRGESIARDYLLSMFGANR